jgi:hypothetical protein
MTINDYAKVLWGAVMGLLLGILVMGTVIDYKMYSIIKVYQPEYEHRVDEGNALIVSDLEQDVIYCVWFKNQCFIPDTMSITDY